MPATSDRAASLTPVPAMLTPLHPTTHPTTMDENTLMREWAGGLYQLELHELPSPHLGRRGPERHTPIGYRLFHNGQLIFEGDDIGVPPEESLDSDQTVRAVLEFLAVRPGDVEPDYFVGSTSAQLAWRDQHAEDLQRLLDEWPPLQSG